MLNAIPPDLFFCGIAGSGMSALAALLSVRGHRVRGSDRSIDAGTPPAVVAALRTMGIQTSPQDGSGVGPGTGAVVVSSAVESDIPDVVAAKALGIPLVTRAELLARVFNQGVGVAVGGTSGKTTVTGMIAHVLRENGRDPTVVNGGRMLNSLPCDPLSSVWTGDSELTVIEADESDGSIAGYNPAVAAVTTVSLDHLPMARLEELFEQFVCRSSVGAVVNQGWGTGRSLAGIRDGVRTFGLEQPEADLNAEALRPSRDGIRFTCRGKPYELAVLGRHNVANAVCAAGCCELLGVEVSAALAALATFRGIGRRLERLGQTTSWMTVYDDFAHNPEKIAASLSTLKEHGDAVRVF